MPTLVSLSLESGSFSRMATLALFVGVSGCQLLFGSYEMDPGAGGAAGTGAAAGAVGSAGTPNQAGATATGGTTSSTCTEGQYNCTSTGMLQRCQGGNWVDIEPCAKLELCSSLRGRCDTCAPSEYQCNGTNTVEQCNSTQNGWLPYASCSGREYCDPKTFVCAVCPQGWSCQNPTTLIQCSSNQKAIAQTITCTDFDGQCHSTGTGDGYCTECQGSDSYCTTGDIIWTCSNGRYIVTDDCSMTPGCQTVNGVASCIR